MKRPDLATLALVALCVVAIAVLAALKVDVPAVLNTIALVGAGGAVGIALPQASASTTIATPALYVPQPAAQLGAEQLVARTTPAPVPATVATPAAATTAAPVQAVPGVTSTFPAAGD